MSPPSFYNHPRKRHHCSSSIRSIDDDVDVDVNGSEFLVLSNDISNDIMYVGSEEVKDAYD